MQTQEQSPDLTNFSGRKIKKKVMSSEFTKEQVVAYVQDTPDHDISYSFSLAGLDRLYRGELPKRNAGLIVTRIAEKLGCKVDEFLEVRQIDLF